GRTNIAVYVGGVAADEVGRQPWKPIGLVVSPAKVDGNVLSLDDSGLLQPLPKRCDKWRGASSRRATEEPDHRHRRLLRARRERPRGCAAEQRDEIAAFHSITSSARASSEGGTVSPSTCAVVRLITRSNLVGCSTGMSPGFDPRSILST